MNYHRKGQKRINRLREDRNRKAIQRHGGLEIVEKGHRRFYVPLGFLLSAVLPCVNPACDEICNIRVSQ